MFGDYWIEVRPDEYVLDVSKEKDGSICILAVNKNSEAFNIFGFPVLQDYYSVFDMEEGRIGFAATPGSKKDALAAATLPSSSLSSSN